MKAGSGCAMALAIALASTGAQAATATLTQGGNLNLGTAASGDPSPDAVNDMQGYAAGAMTAIQMLNNAVWTYSSSPSYATSNLSEAQNSSYSASLNWIPSDYSMMGTVYYIRTGTLPNVKFFKLHTNGTNNASGLPLLWDYLGAGVPSPPVSNFSFSSYDLITDFTDTSTGGTPVSWSWTFGDGGTSSSQSPRHRYAGAGTRSACLQAGNSGGNGANACKSVAVSTRPSTLVAVNGSFDLDGDSTADMQVQTEACTYPNKLHMLNGAKYTLLYKDYRTITVSDVGGGPVSTGDFCVNVDYLEGFLVKVSSGAIYRAWTAANDAGGIRLEYALLQAAPPPPPVSNFSFASYDLIVQFTDTSSNSPNGWSWTFGDGGTDTLQGPRYRYATAGTRSACLTASNSGGNGNQACQSVAVSLRPSSVVATASGFDFESDGKADLLVSASGGCPVPNKLTPQNGALYSLLYKDYRNVTVADASAAQYSTSAGGFCVDVDYEQAFLVLSSFGAVYRVWTAANDAGTVRFEYSLLLAQERLFANGFQ